MTNDFNILENKLEAFIKKYYTSLLIKGLLLSFTAVLLLYLFIDFIEYFAWMGKTARQIVFFGFIIYAVAIFIYQVVIPLLKLFRITKTLSFEEAARIVGKHFPEVNDKLLNAIQLKKREKEISEKEMELLIASVSQKTFELKPVPFSGAVDLKKNWKYAGYFLPVAFSILLILLIYPSFITEPSKRIVNYKSHFSKPLPYSVTLISDSLKVIQHNDFVLKVKITGDEIPQDVYIKSPGFNYKLYPAGPETFEYTFKNIDKGFAFNIITGDYVSETYNLKVYPKPVIYSFDVVLDYPSYLKKKQDIITGLGDLIVPEGTVINWRIHVKDAGEVCFLYKDSPSITEKIKENTFRKKLTAKQSFNYSLCASNNHIKAPDTLSYSVQVIKDEFPKIDVKEYVSKDFTGFLQLTGTISDDYGFHSLQVLYKPENEEKNWSVKNINIDKSVPEQYFQYSFILPEMGLKPGDGFNYYFEVRDNDALHGYKVTRSITGYVKLPGKEALEKAADSTAEAVKQSMKDRLKELEEINNKLDEFKTDLLNKKKLSWSDKQKLSELIRKEKDIQEKISELQKLNEEIKNLQEAIKKKADPELQKRLDELQKMFDELNDKDMEKELDKLKKELDKMDKDKLSRFLEEMKKKNETLKENLEQNLELFKQMEIEKKVNEMAQKLQQLSEKQEKLSNETKNKKSNKKDLTEKQEKIKKEFEAIEKELEKISEMDKELEDPFKIEKDSLATGAVNKDMKDAQKELQKNKTNKASKKQKDAAGKMKKMAKDMLNFMMAAMQQRTGEDMEMIRKLLDNLVDLSFKQENIIKEIREISPKDPKFVTSAEELRGIKDGFQIIKDSLTEIGKRQVFIQPFIIRETESVESSLSNAINQMQERRKGESLSRQQYAMTHINNLALMLDEALNKMQQSMSMSSKGGKSCPNPGKGSKPGLKDLMQMQESLSEGLNKSQKGKPKNQKNGKNKNENGENGSAAELAKLAALQYEIRQRLQEYMEELKSNGGNGNALNEVLKDMDKTENDIINRNINRETLERQQKIKVRLLQAQNAEMQREKEKRRESEEGKNSINRNLNKKLKYKSVESGQNGILFLKPVELDFYLRAVYKKYLYKIELNYDEAK
jgi:hypothetical protein